jgi:hypothetical protein
VWDPLMLRRLLVISRTTASSCQISWLCCDKQQAANNSMHTKHNSCSDDNISSIGQQPASQFSSLQCTLHAMHSWCAV